MIYVVAGTFAEAHKAYRTALAKGEAVAVVNELCLYGRRWHKGDTAAYVGTYIDNPHLDNILENLSIMYLTGDNDV